MEVLAINLAAEAVEAAAVAPSTSFTEAHKLSPEVLMLMAEVEDKQEAAAKPLVTLVPPAPSAPPQ